jgi:septum formation protein
LAIPIQISTVTFAKLSDVDIAWYVATNEGLDKAGGYAVQGLAALFIEQIEGSYSGIMGLPLRETGLLLAQIVEH